MSLYDRIRRHEGLRLTVYDDATGKAIMAGSVVKGNPTIGYGALLSAPGGITREEAELLLRNRVAQAETDAATLPAWTKLDAVRRDVLVEMVFQMGLAGVRQFKNTLAAMECGDYEAAAIGMRASLWARQTPERAAELAEIMRTGKGAQDAAVA